jgi:hypothetical protein
MAEPNQRYAKRASILIFTWLMKNAWWVCILSSYPFLTSICTIQDTDHKKESGRECMSEENSFCILFSHPIQNV